MDKMLSNIQKYLSGPRPFKFEIGAGRNKKPGWLSADIKDYYDYSEPDTIIMNAAEPFPIADDTFDYIYSEHMIEHVSFDKGQHMISECHRILRPGGVIRIVTPSLGFLLRVMSVDRGKIEQDYFDWSVVSFFPNAPVRSNAFFLNNFLRNWNHTFIYDRCTMAALLEMSGFSIVKECSFNKSEHPNLNNLENEKRMPESFLELESMVFEATK